MGTPAQRERRKASRKVRRLTNVQVDEISMVDNPAVPEATWIIAKRNQEGEPVSTTEPARDGKQVTDDTVAATDGGDESASRGVDGVGPVAKDGEGGGTDAAAGQPIEKNRRTVGVAFAEAIATLRAVAGEMEPQALYFLAGMIEYGRTMSDVPQMANELNKCSGVDLTKVDYETPYVQGIAKSVAAAVVKAIAESMPGSDLEAAADPEPKAAAAESPVPQEPAAAEPVVKQAEPGILTQVSQLLAKRKADRVAEQAKKMEADLLARVGRVASEVQECLSQAQSLGKRLDKAMGKTS